MIYAFDFEYLNKNLAYGQYMRTRSYFQNSEMEAKGTPSPEELEILNPLKDQIPPEVFTTEYNPPVTDGSGNARDNLAKAAALLDEAGWKVENGKRVKDGKVFRIRVPRRRSGRRAHDPAVRPEPGEDRHRRDRSASSIRRNIRRGSRISTST